MISSARPEDSGRYECVAESTSGHRASLAAQLLVAHDTRIPETSKYYCYYYYSYLNNLKILQRIHLKLFIIHTYINRD